jgi:hypothetical protein
LVFHLGALSQRLATVSDGSRKLHVLVLSHLHIDHVNGFKLLCQNQVLRIHRLIIPHYNDYEKLFLLAKAATAGLSAPVIEEYHEVLTNPGGWFSARGVQQVIGVRPADDEAGDVEPPQMPDTGPPDGYDIVPGPDGTAPTAETPLALVCYAPQGSVRRMGQLTSIPNSSVVVAALFNGGARFSGWLLAPFTDRRIPGSQGQKNWTAFQAAVQACLTPHLQKGRLMLDSQGDQCLDCLRNSWRSYVGYNHKTWNILSASCYLGFVTSIDLSAPPHPCCWPCCFSIGCQEGSPQSHTLLGPVTGWLLTGDTYLKNNTWKTYFCPYLPRRPIIQAPHHGSMANFDLSLLSYAPHMIFATCAMKDAKHPSPRLLKTLGTSNYQLHSVTEDPSSMLRSWTVARV